MQNRKQKKTVPIKKTGAVPSRGDAIRPGLPACPGSGWPVLGLCIFLAAITLAVYGGTLRYEFVNYDDGAHVYDNPQVTNGLTLQGIAWAFTHSHNGHWIPLNTISHMLDCQLYGLNPGGHHLTNVLLHAATAVLLFLVLRRMTATLWPAAFVATVFAIHPLHVESVAWVTERKDVLSGFFFMLTLLAYVRYVQNQPRVEGRGSRADAAAPALGPLARRSEAKAARPWTLDFYLVLFFFACGLMSKLMVATLPLVLLALDYWPLNRFAPLPHAEAKGQKRWPVLRRLILEKILLLGVVLLAGLALYIARHQDDETYGVASSLPSQTGRALLTPLTYLRQMVYPAGLCVTPPPPNPDPSIWEVTRGTVLLATISAVFFLHRRRRPYLLVGWLWYLLLLAPVLVLIQKNLELRCDRYTYLPLIGVYLLLTWAALDGSASWRHRRLMAGAAAAVIIAALAWSARIQASSWRNSKTLWMHALSCTSDNSLAHCNLGMALFQEQRVDEAIDQYQKALEIHPGYVEARKNLAATLLDQGRLDEAIIQFQKVLEVRPRDAVSCYNLGNAYLRKRQVRRAIELFQRTVALRPTQADALNNLAWLLATAPDAALRNGAQAVDLAERANQLSRGNDPVILCALAAAYAEVGRFPEAVTTAQRAQRLADAQNNPELVAALRDPIASYQAGSPFRDTDQTNAPAPLQ
jgi:protein O-mannosyl-transferase